MSVFDPDFFVAVTNSTFVLSFLSFSLFSISAFWALSETGMKIDVKSNKNFTRFDCKKKQQNLIKVLRDLSEAKVFKALKNTFKPVKIFFSMIHNWPDWFKIKQNTAMSRHFTKPTVYTMYLYNQWNYFQQGCMDKWRSGDFSIQTWCIPLEVFASKKFKKLKIISPILLQICRSSDTNYTLH